VWSPNWWTNLVQEGEAPDPRMTFANERTFLAWIRTAMALIAGGLGVEAFAHDLPGWARTAIAISLVGVGGLLGASAFRRWLQAELALRRREPFPPSRTPQLVSVAIAAVAFAIALVIALA